MSEQFKPGLPTRELFEYELELDKLARGEISPPSSAEEAFQAARKGLTRDLETARKRMHLVHEDLFVIISV